MDIREIPDSHIKWLFQQIFRKPAIAITVIIGTIVTIMITMARPFLTGLLFDVLWSKYLEIPITPVVDFLSLIIVDYEALWLIFGIFLTGIVGFIVNVFIGVLNEYLAQHTEKSIREDFYASVQSKSMAFHDTAKVGELMSQATFDVRIINATISPGLRMITQAIITAGIAFGMIFWYKWEIGLMAIAFIPFYIWTLRRYARNMAPLTQKVQTQFGVCNAHLQENVSGIRVIRAFTAERHETKRFQKEVDTLRDDIIDRGVQQARYFPPLILSLSITAAIGLSVWFITQGVMTGGEAIIINGALIQLYNPTYMISWVLFLTHMGIAGAKRIIGTMKEEEIIIEKPEAVILEDVKGVIEYKDVHFSYHKLRDKKITSKKEGTESIEQEKPETKIRDTLEGINFKTQPGDIVAILGPTGCGKSTITKLLARMYDVDSGEILVDGYNIQDLTLESLRKNIGVIEQDIFLFSTTIKENIKYGVDREVSDEEIVEYAKAAQAHDFIMTFQEGYETLVGERGVTLSGGQKQRIAIARAFLANPKILILDDSASAIDAQTEEKIQKAMDNLLENRTVFIITHRLATIKRANKIIVLRKGVIVAQGYHDKLLKTSEDYRRVFGRHLDLPPIEPETVGSAAGGSK
ncbi:MAG: ABC transporter ATP-binding protein [Candidatus Heimdallarchaeota archaeon]|nr:MAG: ABC transporter ATP-binding protein [Candidatus Heimdallarchaeota archaeon]